MLSAFICIIIVFAVFIFLWFHKYRTGNDLIKYKAYLIEIESSDYSPKTKCGRIDIVVKNSENISDKLFTTENDVMNNKNMQIVDADYGLRIIRDNIPAKFYIQELKFENNTQFIAINYINTADIPHDYSAIIQILQFPGATLEKEFEAGTDSETDSLSLSAGNNSGTILASTHGMFINNAGTETMHIFNIKVYYNDGKENTLFLANEFNVNEKKTNYVQVSYENSDSQKYYYCWDFGDLQNIKYIEIDNRFYKPKI